MLNVSPTAVIRAMLRRAFPRLSVVEGGEMPRRPSGWVHAGWVHEGQGLGGGAGSRRLLDLINAGGIVPPSLSGGPRQDVPVQRARWADREDYTVLAHEPYPQASDDQVLIGAVRQPCSCSNGCTDCPGDDGLFRTCPGCKHPRKVPGAADTLASIDSVLEGQ